MPEVFPQNHQPPKSKRRGKTLAAVVGTAVAAALAVSIPKEESGRTVEATVDPVTTELNVRHISGRQYLRAYLDVVGVATACDGLTSYRGRPVRITDQFTEEQCEEMLEEELVAHAERVMACSPGLALSTDPATERRREGPRFMAVDVGYNVGTAAYCSSTGRRRFNAGDYPGGCEALTWFNKAGGRVNRGLQARRARGYAKCIGGLSA